MVNYTNAKIYKIVDNTNGKVYIGSTSSQLLCQRLAQHRIAYNRYVDGKRKYYSAFDIIKNNDCEIVLLEEVKDCQSKEHLKQRERHYIEIMECINKNKPIITEQELAEYRSRYGKIYRTANKEKNKEYQKTYSKKYYENNKEKLKEHYRNKYQKKIKPNSAC
jgi:hypothetical protein